MRWISAERDRDIETETYIERGIERETERDIEREEVADGCGVVSGGESGVSP